MLVVLVGSRVHHGVRVRLSNIIDTSGYFFIIRLCLFLVCVSCSCFPDNAVCVRGPVEQTELTTKIRGLTSREQHSSADLDMTVEKLREIERNVKTAATKRIEVI